MKLKHLSLIALSSLFLIFTSCGGDPVELRLNVAKGVQFECLVKMDQKIETKAMGTTMKINQLIEVNQTLSVQDIAGNGNVTFQNVMNRFYMKQGMNMMGIPMNMEFDTDHPEKTNGMMGATMGQYFSKMKGLTYILEMDKQGKLVSSNMEEVYAKLGLDSLSQQGGNNNGGNNADQYMSQLPDKPVKEGDTYVVETEVTSLGEVGMKNTYTIKEITSESVIMDMKTEFIKGKENKSSEMNIDISGEQSGTVTIDRKTGMTMKSDIKQNLKMTVRSEGTEMPMTSQGTVTFTCTKK